MPFESQVDVGNALIRWMFGRFFLRSGLAMDSFVNHFFRHCSNAVTLTCVLYISINTMLDCWMD